ncbi:MAG: hypothetical protein ACPG52_03145 [Cognaticolwellia sp.]
MNIIFVADIFGITPEFKQLCQQVMHELADIGSLESHLIGPYQNQAKQFNCEGDAYQYFMKNITLAGYAKTLTQSLSQITGDKLLVGFSVGGSAIWQLAASGACKSYLGAICFYSSQIRYMHELTPRIPTRVILPAAEQYFSVVELGKVLQEKPTVIVEQSEGLHGFINQRSAHYHHGICQYYIKRLARLLTNAIH